MREILLALQNLKRSGLSLRLTALSVLIGLSSVILISSIGKSGKESILRTIEGIGISGIMFSHSYSDYDGISFDNRTLNALNDRGLDIAAMPFSIHSGNVSLLSESASALIWGIGSDADHYIQGKLLYGRFPTDDEISDCSCVAVISDSLAERAFSRCNVVGQMLSVGSEGSSCLYQIVGVMESQTASFQMFTENTPDFVYAPYTTLRQYHDYHAGNILVKSPTLSDAAIKSEVKHTLQAYYGSNLQLNITNLNQGKKGILEVADLLTLVLSLSAATSLLVAAIGIASSMLASVNERRQEIGIMKALGASNLQVALCFLWESLLTCMLGTVLGIVFCLLVMRIISRATILANVLDYQTIVITLLVTTFFGLLAGTIPAVHAAHQDPIDALKNNL